MVPEGTADVPVNQVIAVLAGDGEDVKAAAAAACVSQGRPGARVACCSSGCSKARARNCRGNSCTGCESRRRRRLNPAKANGGDRIFSSPLARRLAKEAGIDIASIEGSGPHGRVIARDIDAAKSGKGLQARGCRATAAASAPVIAPALGDEKIRALYADGSYEVIPHDNMRKVIAQRLTASTQTVPHFYLTVDCNIGKLTAAREEINAQAPKDKDGKPAYKLSVNDFVIKALGLALQRDSERQCELDRSRHAEAQAFRRRRRGRHAGWADHADHSLGRNKIAIDDFQ